MTAPPRICPGAALPALTLAASDGSRVDLRGPGDGRTILYLYPLTGRPGVDLPRGSALGLPTFAADGHERLYRRLTLVVTGGPIEHVFYPVFPPSTHAQEVLDWVRRAGY
jgi:peroxiredoxin